MEINVVDPIVIGVTLPTPPLVGASPGAVVILVPWPGPRGQAGPPGTNSPVIGEAPTGLQNGTNTVFSTAHAFISGSTAVYRNGLREVLGSGYTEGSSQITFVQPPLSSDVIEIDYLAS